MGLRDKIKRIKDSLRKEPKQNKPGVIEQLIKSTATPTSVSISKLKPPDNATSFLTSAGPSSISVSMTQTPLTGTTSPPVTLPPGALKDLWLEAVETLKSQEPDLMEDYSRILLHESNVKPGISRIQYEPIPNDMLVQLTKEKLSNFTIPSSRSAEKVEKVVKAVIAAKAFIGSTLEAEPHAAIAWAGVSMFLPLLINPMTEKSDCREGLEKIAPLIDRYALLESSIWNPISTDELRSSSVKLHLRNVIIKLYTAVLLYEARAIVQFCGKSVTRYVRDAFKLNEWAKMFDEINKLDQQCKNLIDGLDRDLNHKVLEEQQKMLDEALEEFKAVKKAKDHQECLQSFRTGNLYELQKNQNPSRVPGTCNWVLNHPSFINWRQGDGPGLLWVSADPGYGKTVLSKALIDEQEHLLETDQNTDVCYFFFKDVSKEQSSVTKALAALLHQIFSSQKELLVHTESSWAKNGTETSNLITEMWGIIESIAVDKNAGNIICILDALDECDDKERKYLLEQLQVLYKAKTPDTSVRDSRSRVTAESLHIEAPRSKVRFLITSRPYYGIEEEFKSLTDKFPGIRLAGEETTETVMQEINLVIDAEVDKLELSTKTDTQLRTRLKAIEHRTYLWLHLIMDSIHYRTKGSKLSKTFEKILDEPLPATIDEAYDDILSKSPDKDEAVRLLHIVVGAERPLTLEELNIAFNIDECYDGSQSFEDIELENLEYFPKRIRYLCGLFVSISASRVYLIHQTAKEFLVSKGASHSALGWKYCLKPDITQSILARVCVSYLYLTMFTEIATLAQCFGSSVKGSSIVPNKGKFKFLKYSADHWMMHHKRSSGDLSLVIIADLCSPTIRRTIWLQACLRGESPPKQFQGIAYAISKALKKEDSIEAGTIPTLMIASCFGLVDVVETLLISSLSQNELYEYWNGESALSFAIINGDYKMTELLISAGANIDDNDSDSSIQSALAVAVNHKRKDIMKLLLDNKAGTNAALVTSAKDYFRRSKDGSEYFDLILRRNGPLAPELRVRLLKTAMSMGPDRETVTQAVKFILMCPCERSVEETMQIPLFDVLSDHFHNVNVCSLIINDSAIHNIDNCWPMTRSTAIDYSPSAVHFVARSGQLALLKLLRARGSSLDISSKLGSAFYYAAYSGNVASVEFFVQENPHLLTQYINGDEENSPLVIAAAKGNYDMVRWLIDHGADVNQGIGHWSALKEEVYYSAIQAAAGKADGKILQLLLNQPHANANINRGGPSTIWLAVPYADDGRLKLLLEHGASPKHADTLKDDVGLVLIDFQVSQLQMLIDYGFDINSEVAGRSFLSHAACSGNIGRVKWLIDHGANVDGQCSGLKFIHSSPLMEAIWGCDNAPAIVEILLENGANVDGPSNYQVYGGPIVASSVHLAILQNYTEVLQTLLDYGADVNLKGENYGIPLKEVTVRGQIHIIQLLVSYGADVDAIGESIPILHEAVFHQQMDAVNLLLDLGAYINISDRLRGTPLQLAKDMHSVEMISLLNRRGAAEVCNSKSVGISRFRHQPYGHTSTTSLVLPRLDIESPDPTIFSRRRSLALQTWGSYAFDYHGIRSTIISSGEEFVDDVLWRLSVGIDDKTDLGDTSDDSNITSQSKISALSDTEPAAVYKIPDLAPKNSAVRLGPYKTLNLKFKQKLSSLRYPQMESIPPLDLSKLRARRIQIPISVTEGDSSNRATPYSFTVGESIPRKL